MAEAKKITSFEAASLSAGKLQVKRLAADLSDKTEEYTLVMDFNAIAKAQEHIGRDLTDVRNWQTLNGVEIITVTWCALGRFHPDLTLDEVRGMLPPSQTYAIVNMLLEMCFPGFTERVLEIMRREQADKKEGEKSPNPPNAGDASATS